MKLAALLGAWGLLNSCTIGAQRQTEEEIRAREPVLLTQRVAYGYTDAPGDEVRWVGVGELILTPSSLYVVADVGQLGGPSNLVVSYATMAGVEIGSVKFRKIPPFGKPTTIAGVLLISPLDGAVRGKDATTGFSHNRFVFNLLEADSRMAENTARPAALRARAIIAEQRSKVDAFGRLDRGREAWFAARVKIGRPSAWSRRLVAYLEKNGAVDTSKKGALRDRFLPSGPSWTTEFDQQARAALREKGPNFTFRPLNPEDVNWDLRRYGITPAEELSKSQRDLDRFLAIEVTSILFRIVPGSGRIEASYKILADFFDLRPAKPGSHFWVTHTVTRSAQEWLSGGEALILADLAAGAQIVAGKVRAEL